MGKSKNDITLSDKQIHFCKQYITCKDYWQASFFTDLKLSFFPGSKYFVYLLINPINNKVFYVGKGKGKRHYDHINEARKTTIGNFSKIKAIRDIIDQGEDVLIKYFAIDLEESEAFKIERGIIKILKEELTNISGGIRKLSAKDWALYQLSKCKTLSKYIAEGHSPASVETFMRVIAEFKKISIEGYSSTLTSQAVLK